MYGINLKSEIFIKLLEFGEKKGLNGTNIPELEDWALKEGFLKNEGQDDDYITKRNALRKLFNECFYEIISGGQNGKLTAHIMKNEYYFRLIEYRELQEARNASREANRNAMIANKTANFAIIISIIAILVGLFASIFLTITPIRINQSDLEILVNGKTQSVQSIN